MSAAQLLRLRQVHVLLWLLPCWAERTHSLLDLQPLPSNCHGGVIQLDGRYATVDVVEYHEDCVLRGAPGTEVEVAGEIHFLQSAWLEGSLRFRKAKTPVVEGHRCVDVEGSLSFGTDADVEFIDCGSAETEDGGAFYVERNLNISSGRVLAQHCAAIYGACGFVGGRFTMTGGSLVLQDAAANESGGALYVKDGYDQLGPNSSVTVIASRAGLYGGGIYVSNGTFNLAGALRFEDCWAGVAGGGVNVLPGGTGSSSALAGRVSLKERKRRMGTLTLEPSGVLEAKNCSTDSIRGAGAVLTARDGVMAGRATLDGCRAGNAGCIELKGKLTIPRSGVLSIGNCWASSYGGAIMSGEMHVHGQVQISNCSAAVGGSIYSYWGKLAFKEHSLMKIQNSTAMRSGGAIWTKSILQEGGEVSFSQCRSKLKGGAIHSYDVMNQIAGSMSFDNCSSGIGGAAFVLAVETQGALSFRHCHALGPGGAIYAVGAVRQLDNRSSMVFKHCRSKKSGGAIFTVLLVQTGRMEFIHCSAKRSGGACSVNDAVNMEIMDGKKASTDRQLSPARHALMKYAGTLAHVKGMVQLNGSSLFRNCSAGAGGALFARSDVILVKNAKASFETCRADAFGGALHGKDIELIGDVLFRNISALAGGIIQSTGKVKVPGAVMQETTAPQISALKYIQMSNVTVENTSHVWFVAPEIHLKDVRCDNGLASFKEPHHVGCRTCEENKLQVDGGPVLDDHVPVQECSLAPRGTAEIDTYHLKLKRGYMTEKANITRSFRCPNRMACIGGTVSTGGWGAMCADGYQGQGCSMCSGNYGPADNTVFVCVQCASQTWRKNLQIARFVLQDLVIFGVSVLGVSSGSSKQVDSKIMTNHFMSFVAAAAPVLQAVQETPTFKRLMESADTYMDGFSSALEPGEASGSGSAISARCILSYLKLPEVWWARVLANLLTPVLAVITLTLLRGWRIAVVVGVNCFLPKACLCFARYLVCYRMEPEHEGGQLFCEYAMFTNFSLVGLLLVVASVATAGPALWWMLLRDEANKDAPFYLYLTASYEEDRKSWEVTRLVRKALLAIICAALPISLHPAMQIMCISLVLLTALVLEMRFHPYKSNRWNLEEQILLIVSLSMVSITSCYLANEYHWSSTHRNQCFLMFIILLLSVVPACVLSILILRQLLAEKLQQVTKQEETAETT